MKVTLGDTTVEITGPITVQIEVDPDGETLPPITINATGGPLEVYRSAVTLNGDNVHVHVFGDSPPSQT